MRQIISHHDGHGLNERLKITADPLDHANGGGASHNYSVSVLGTATAWSLDVVAAQIQFQHGPRDAVGSRPGITEAALYAILIDRLRAFQAGPFPDAENDVQIKLLEQCLASTRKRADGRAARGVLGKNEP